LGTIQTLSRRGVPIVRQVHYPPERLLACRMIVGNIHSRALATASHYDVVGLLTD
jgi:hypothetical protein